jgi:ABC-type Fe3+ transport system permease subunit
MSGHLIVDLLVVVPSQIPNPGPVAPPGSEKILQIVGWMKWVALASIVGLFFGGIVVSTVGRVGDHHGSGRTGARLIVASLALAFLSAIGYGVITTLAGGG